MKILLPSTYFGSTFWYAMFLLGEEVQIESHENFKKQTLRNRCEILGPNGKQSLVIPVLNKNSKSGIQNMELNHKENWAWNHFHSIQSAYGKSPFFEYYKDALEALYLEAENHNLWTWNQACLQLTLKWLKEDKSPKTTDSYMSNFDGLDARDWFKPSKPVIDAPSSRYLQVFSDRFEFISNLSILDLVFNLGPQARNYLNNPLYKQCLHDARTA